MNKVFEKILERLEEMIHPKGLYFCKYAQGGCRHLYNDEKDCMECVVELSEEIVKEVAEEFATDTNVGTNGWIPCSVRLPEEESDVLLSLRSLDVYTGFRANAEGCFYIDGDGYVEYENVIAWMPLPEPYKESED